MSEPSTPDTSLVLDLFARAPGMLALANVQGTLLSVNPAWAVTLGDPPGEPPEPRLTARAHPDDRDAVAALLARVATGALDVSVAEHRFAHADGSWRVLQWRAARSGDGDALYLWADDVTARRAELDALAAEVDAITSSVSHDLRAPLRAIDGFSRILLVDHAGELPEDTRRFLALVRDAGSELAGLFDDLLAVARVVREPLELVDDVDLGALAHELVDAVLRPRQGDRDVTWTIDAVPPCRCDPRLARRLLEALLDNALKFTGPREHAHIALTFDAAQRAYAVRDDGVGFDPALLPKAYGLFQRLHRRETFPGSGIGLSLAARVAGRHGGRIWGTGAPDGGATFWFTLGRGGP